jgi:photosystem II stability/assembly factor-like uncharacterized protein
LRTEDGGATWPPIIQGAGLSIDGIHFANSQTGMAVGLEGVAFQTDDGGQTWLQVPPPTRNYLQQVRFLNSDRAIVVGEDGTILEFRPGDS